MGGLNELQLFADSPLQAEAFGIFAKEEVKRIETKFSRYLPESIISRINAAAGKGRIAVDEETAALIDYAAVCFNQSKGLFDITSGIYRKVWDFTEGNKSLPTTAQIASVCSLVGWDKVRWNKPNIELMKAGMQLDFGGIGKEYAVDRVAGILEERGVKSALINFAGDIRVVGTRSDNRPWVVGITHPRKKGEAATVIELKSGALATSGDYERYIEVNGIRYCHILNPKTGFPTLANASVTVLAPSCLIAGSASTIGMLMSEKESAKFLKNLNTPYFRVDSQGNYFAFPESSTVMKTAHVSSDDDTRSIGAINEIRL